MQRTIGKGRILCLLTCLMLVDRIVSAADWPAYRANNARTATTPEKLQFPLALKWKYVPAQKHQPAWPDPYSIVKRGMSFDYAPAPVIAGNVVYFGSTTDNTLWALDGATGKTKWAFTTGGPIRFAPAIADGNAYVVSDDGVLYCLDAATGKLLWEFGGGLNDRKVIGNGRMISRWPIRSGVAVQQGVVYFAAGMWSTEGVYAFALDAKTGKQRWCNDANIELTVRPHGSAAMLGNMPQGYLAIDENRVGFNNGITGVYWYDTQTGRALDKTRIGDPRKIDYMQLVIKPSEDSGSVPAHAALAGDTAIRCEQGKVVARSANDRETPLWEHEIEGTAFGLAAGNGMLVVTSTDGAIYCFRDAGSGLRAAGKSAAVGPGVTAKAKPPEPAGSAVVALQELAKQKITKGYALVLGASDARLAEAIAAKTQLQVICALGDKARVDAERKRLRDTTGLYGRIMVDYLEDPRRLPYPQFFANLIVVDHAAAGLPTEEIKRVQRPCGGIIVASGKVAARGKLPGAYDWDSKVTSDQLVRGPLELLWFGEPGPSTMAGKSSKPKPANGRVFFVGHSTLVVADAYNGTVLWQRKLSRPETRSIAADDRFVRIGSQTFDAQTGKEAPGQTVQIGNRTDEPKRSLEDQKKYLGPRIHPLTGGQTSKFYSKSYGCGGGKRAPKPSATMDFFRSSTLGYYDYEDDSGMRNFSGIRPGCQFGTYVPALGLLLSSEGQGLPGGGGATCTCNYNYHSSLALVPALQRRNEDWALFGDIRSQVAGAIRHASLNFGAPGDRRDNAKTLWLAAPRPYYLKEAEKLAIPLSYSAEFYNDSRRYRRNADRLPVSGTDKPWVYTSGYLGLKRVSLDLDYYDDKTHLLSVATANAPVIDGSLTDPCWQGEGQIFRHFIRRNTWGIGNEFQRLAGSYYNETLGDPPRVGYIRHDDEHLYLAYRKPVVVDRRGGSDPIKADTKGEDAPVWEDDALNVFLTDHTGNTIVHLGVSASGATYDGLIEGPFPTGQKAGKRAQKTKRGKGAPVQNAADSGWNGEWSSAAKVDKEAFSVEIKLPWETLEQLGLKKGNLLANLARSAPLGSAGEFLENGSKLHVSGLKAVPKPYTVRLHFAELENDGPGQRVFDVKLGNEVVLEDFDIFAAAGGKNMAVVKEFKGIPAAQSLVLELIAKKQPLNDLSMPIISGIEIMAEQPGPVPPPIFGPLNKGDQTQPVPTAAK